MHVFYCLTIKRPYFVEMKSSCFFLLLASCVFGSIASKPNQTDAKKPVQVDDGNIVLHQTFNTGATKADISSLRAELEKLRKDLTKLLDKNKTKGKAPIISLHVIFSGIFINNLIHSIERIYHL